MNGLMCDAKFQSQFFITTISKQEFVKKNYVCCFLVFYFLMSFTPYKAIQPLLDIKLQLRKGKK